MKLLTSNAKLGKSVPGWHILGLQLLPGRSAGVGELCPQRGECYSVCLAWAGLGGLASVRKARRDRTRFLFQDPQGFADMLDYELFGALADARADRCKLAVRLNVFSDIDYYADHSAVADVLLKYCRDVAFYDYTKRTDRPSPLYWDERLRLWRVCYSWSERSTVVPSWALWVSVVGDAIPWTLRKHSGLGVNPLPADGDVDDLFFLRPCGIQLLSPKGKARREGSAPGFVQRADVADILRNAEDFVAEKRAKGWTQSDFAQGLDRFFRSGGVG